MGKWFRLDGSGHVCEILVPSASALSDSLFDYTRRRWLLNGTFFVIPRIEDAHACFILKRFVARTIQLQKVASSTKRGILQKLHMRRIL